jgi:hypothetical protein
MLGAVAVLALAGSTLSMAAASASAGGATQAALTAAARSARQLGVQQARQSVSRPSTGRARPDAAQSCQTADRVRTCLSISGSHQVLGDMVGSFTNISRGGFSGAVVVSGPRSFAIASSDPTLGNGEGVQIGWLQSTNSAAGKYCAQGYWHHGSQFTAIGPSACINVRS